MSPPAGSLRPLPIDALDLPDGVDPLVRRVYDHIYVRPFVNDDGALAYNVVFSLPEPRFDLAWARSEPDDGAGQAALRVAETIAETIRELAGWV